MQSKASEYCDYCDFVIRSPPLDNAYRDALDLGSCDGTDICTSLAATSDARNQSLVRCHWFSQVPANRGCPTVQLAWWFCCKPVAGAVLLLSAELEKGCNHDPTRLVQGDECIAWMHCCGGSLSSSKSSCQRNGFSNVENSGIPMLVVVQWWSKEGEKRAKEKRARGGCPSPLSRPPPSGKAGVSHARETVHDVSSSEEKGNVECWWCVRQIFWLAAGVGVGVEGGGASSDECGFSVMMASVAFFCESICSFPLTPPGCVLCWRGEKKVLFALGASAR
ncbi:hypothetical protein QBC47DRAFT_121644 [Echria macrotheca]|uniref:Uncharacterized protein n=1 Tax=Echria macrotheca TaxID=438768 RepID=A0AAJ0B2W2_9PEZI|nr:hypothetical protein QBC47DRAFT_121644 [Echria macrotheca]